MLTSRLPQSTCGFASTRRPSSAAAASPPSSLLPTVVEVSHSTDATPTHLFMGCCGAKSRMVNSSALNCCSSALSVHRNSQPSPSSSTAVSALSTTLSTFRPAQNVDVTCHRAFNNDVLSLSLSSDCCTDCRQSSTAELLSTFPPPPPPLSPSFVASLPTVDVVDSCTSPCTACSSRELTWSWKSASQTSLISHHSPCIDGGFQQMNTPPPPPPGVVPCLIPPPPLLPPGHQNGPPSSSSSSQSTSVCGRTPRTKLRRLQWHKIPDSRVRAVGSGCVWAHVQRQLKADSAAACSVDLERVEELFTVGSSSSAGVQGMTRPKSGPATVALERRKSDQV